MDRPTNLHPMVVPVPIRDGSRTRGNSTTGTVLLRSETVRRRKPRMNGRPPTGIRGRPRREAAPPVRPTPSPALSTRSPDGSEKVSSQLGRQKHSPILRQLPRHSPHYWE
jgi:hypothetical protein